MATLLYLEYLGRGRGKLDVSELLIERKTYWYGIYQGNKKIGFSSYTVEKIGDDHIFKNENYLRAREDEAEIIESIKCITDSSYIPRHFEYTIEKGKEKVTIRGENDKKDIIFFIEMPDKRFTRKLPLEGKNFYLPVMLIPVLHQNMINSKEQVLKKVFSIPILEIKNFNITNVRVTLEEIIPVKVGINVLSVFKYRIGDTTFFVNEKGIPVKEVNPSGMVYYLSNKDWAGLFDSPPEMVFDYTTLRYFKTDKLIPAPEELHSLEVAIDGFLLDPDLYASTRVSLKGNRLIIMKEELEDNPQRTYTLPLQDERLKKYLLPDKWIRSDLEDLKRTGKIYASSEKGDALSFGRYLVSYLFNLFVTQPEFIIKDSGYIVDYRRGDFIERSLLYATYARAGGLPTRLVGGFVYRNGYFFFHIWPEIWLNGWVPVDPSMYQFPADVTHIPLTTGELDEILATIERAQDINIKIIALK